MVHDGNQRGPDEAIDRAVRALADRLPDTAPTVDEQTLLAYVHGEADAETVARVRRALVRSPSLRATVAELSEHLDRLQDPDVQAAFARADTGAVPDREQVLGPDDPWAEARARARGRGRRPRWATSWLRPLRLSPVLAAAAVFLLMLYPTVRYFTASSTPDLVVGARLHHLDATPQVLRGEEAPPATTITLPPAQEILNLALWTETALTPGATYRLEVADATGTVWRDDAFQPPLDPLDPHHVDLVVRADRLAEGAVTVRLRSQPSAEPALDETYRFLLVRGS